ncbi:cobyrinate a,c-diamide synthase [Prochlorococcus sp. MIT 1307]|uniref:cobyrinate a,c-diamide synthase n=1 Tax=Prochlorococcus sp. MIT 1307 TaxID=3096219 RepID=UPI002A75270D|nr:cobyrinate a,c-diamide synthase [Prochlorococcus sp. MIT 1307]
MAFVIAAPASGNGKTLLGIVLAAWARKRSLKLQTFKVGPDYLDPQQLSVVSKRPCHNLDLILCGSKWVTDSFYNFGGSADLALVEGVMGLFDGVGTSSEGSTAALARCLQLPIVLVVDARGQAASLAALVKGFRDQDPELELAGVVLNHINTARHKALLTEVLESINVKLLGCLPSDSKLKLTRRHLGLVPAHEIQNIQHKVEDWAAIAESHLNLKSFRALLQPPKPKQNLNSQLITLESTKTHLQPSPIAVAEDKAFHFRYPETKESLESLGMPCITWQPIANEPIPKEAKGLIIPGGFPEQYAEQLSTCTESINSLRSFCSQYPTYAECGGMLLLGKTLTDLKGKTHQMAGLLPFDAKKGPLKVGYRNISCRRDGLVTRAGEKLIGHEFHHWKLNINHETNISDAVISTNAKEKDFHALWNIKGWGIEEIEEGWGNKLIHASWIHLHWPSASKTMQYWKNAVERNKTKGNVSM